MRIALAVPDGFGNDEKGDFFEDFVAELLRPMRLKVTKRVRFAGMEIDLLAKDADQPNTYLVECKAHSDPLPADVISKALGNAQIRGADAAWLFSTSDFSKAGRGQYEEITADPKLKRQFTWFRPERICELLIEQRSVVDPRRFPLKIEGMEEGDWHLIIHPEHRTWLVELVEEGVPRAYAAFRAREGTRVASAKGIQLGSLAGRFESLTFVPPAEVSARTGEGAKTRATVARVTSGDAWEDPRPSRPGDFVGREALIENVARFLQQIRLRETSTRCFAVQAPSGWGKSSLAIKLSDLARKGRIVGECSVTAIDSRSATDSAFVAEAVRIAMKDAEARNFVSKRSYAVPSLHHPLHGADYLKAYDELAAADRLIVLMFDQFEELFSKEQLFETFNAVRELSLDLDSEQYPIALGFAWKTDVALPQQHPAYHLWHHLADRRRAFLVPEFGRGDTKRVITKAEKALEKKLSPALRSRLVEQCQGLPWLLKKLLVHVLQRVSTRESQYLLLERELDVEVLFREDLATLPESAIRCLRFVAQAAPVPVTEVEENFDRDTTNLLLGSRLIVRSGMNYVIYWDIFRDYLLEGKVPQIPWARTFQRDPAVGVRVLQSLVEIQPATAAEIGAEIGLKERPTQNVLSDLVALQLVDRVSGDRYRVATVLDDVDAETISDHARGQLQRHVVTKGIQSDWDRQDRFGPTEWDAFYAGLQPRSEDFSAKTVHFYAANLRRWLVFAGLLNQTGSALSRPQGVGRDKGVLSSRRVTRGVFLGTSSAAQVLTLLERLGERGGTEERTALKEMGLRNAIADGRALGLVVTDSEGSVRLSVEERGRTSWESVLAEALRDDPIVQFVRKWEGTSAEERVTIGDKLEEFVSAAWAESSKKRYVSGLMRFLAWLRQTSVWRDLV